VAKQTFGLVRKQDAFDDSFDAIVGLAYPAMAEEAGLPLFDEMIEQGLLTRNLFAFYLSHNDDEPSELIFGAYDQTKFEGDLQCHSVVDELFWAL